MNLGSAVRGAFAVIAGYIVFAVAAGTLFAVTGHDPNAPASGAFMILSTACGMFFALAGGYLTGLIAGRLEIRHAMILGGLMALGALISFAVRPSDGAVWSQLVSVIFMSPSAVLGGTVRRAQTASRPPV